MPIFEDPNPIAVPSTGSTLHRTKKASDIGIDLMSTEQTVDQQAAELIAALGGDAFISSAGVLTTGTPEDLESSQHPELMGAGSDQMEAAIAGGQPPDTPGPGPVKPFAQKVRKKFSSQMAPEALIAALMSELAFSPEETSQTSTSRYNPVDAEVPTLGLRGTPGDQWMGLLSALLEEKKNKENTTSKRSLR
jgi:hypothetical protein